jgi:hypothetical protein
MSTGAIVGIISLFFLCLGACVYMYVKKKNKKGPLEQPFISARYLATRDIDESELLENTDGGVSHHEVMSMAETGQKLEQAAALAEQQALAKRQASQRAIDIARLLKSGLDFDPDEGFARNAAAQAYCVGRWRQYHDDDDDEEEEETDSRVEQEQVNRSQVPSAVIMP